MAIATSNPGSIYHGSGTAISKVVNESGALAVTVQPFASPSVYIPAINAGEIPFGLGNVAELRLSVLGQAHFKGRKHPNMRAVAIMYPLRVVLFVRKSSNIKSIADLKGKRVVDGFTSQKIILPLLDAQYATAGMTRKDIKSVRVANVVAGANAFMAGRADAFFFALGAAKVREANAKVGGLRALPIANTPENLAAVRKHWPVGYLRAVKPGKRTPSVEAPTHVVAYDSVVFASDKTPADAVYKLVKVMHGGKKGMAAAFGVFNLFNPKAMAKTIPDVKWHAGAIKFYKEQGLWPPK
jgi:TRAP transporter TAXI family solute receptor